MTGIYLKNLSPTVAVPGATPEEIWTGYKTDVSHLRVFGSKAYAHIPNKLRKKFDAKSKQYLMVGYCEHTKGYRLADPERPWKVIKARSVKFLETTEKKMPEPEVEVIIHESSQEEEHQDVPEIEDDNEEANSNIDSGEASIAESMSEDYESDDDSSDTLVSANEDEDDISDVEDQPVVINEANDARPIRERRKPNWMEDYEMSAVSFINNVGSNEPLTYAEAISCANHKNWKIVMQTEYNSLIENNVWELVNRPENVNIVKCKWVYKVKKNASGDFERYKARLVARGFSQRYGIDFEETFAPVVKHSTIRLLFAIANERNMDIDHLDVKTAFLNGELDEKIYMEQPSGFETEKTKQVCLLKKCIYGLKQASRAWNKRIHLVLKKIRYTV